MLWVDFFIPQPLEQLPIGFWQNVEPHLSLLTKSHRLAEEDDCVVLEGLKFIDYLRLICVHLWLVLVGNRLMDRMQQQKKGFPQHFPACFCQAVISLWERSLLPAPSMSRPGGRWSITCWLTLSVSHTVHTTSFLPLQSLVLPMHITRQRTDTQTISASSHMLTCWCFVQFAVVYAFDC